MKRILFVAVLLVLIAIALVYFLIPNHIVINKSLVFAANKDALYRKIGVTNSWNEWWPGNAGETRGEPSYISNSISFKPGPLQFTSVPLSINLDDMAVKTDLTLIPIHADYGTILINKGKGQFTTSTMNGLAIKGQVRSINPIRIGKKEAFLLACNNDSARVISFQKP